MFLFNVYTLTRYHQFLLTQGPIIQFLNYIDLPILQIKPLTVYFILKVGSSSEKILNTKSLCCMLEALLKPGATSLLGNYSFAIIQGFKNHTLRQWHWKMRECYDTVMRNTLHSRSIINYFHCYLFNTHLLYFYYAHGIMNKVEKEEKI